MLSMVTIGPAIKVTISVYNDIFDVKTEKHMQVEATKVVGAVGK